MLVRGKEKTMGQKQKKTKLIKKYLQIYEALRNKIVTGAIAYRQKLPSKRVTAEQWQASVVTVEHAYDILQSEGYIESRERSGYYACYRAGAVYRSQEASALPPQPAEPFGEEGLTFAQLAKTTRFVLNEYGEVLLQKSPENGVWVLRNAIRNYLARNRGIDCYNALRRRETVTLDDGLAETLGELAEFDRATTEAADLVGALVAAMTPPDRDIFLRKYYLLQSGKEIAAALGMSVESVNTRLSRGRDRLRRELTAKGVYSHA